MSPDTAFIYNYFSHNNRYSLLYLLRLTTSTILPFKTYILASTVSFGQYTLVSILLDIYMLHIMYLHRPQRLWDISFNLRNFISPCSSISAAFFTFVFYFFPYLYRWLLYMVHVTHCPGPKHDIRLQAPVHCP